MGVSNFTHERALLKAIRFFGSQKELGKALNVSQQRINYWLNNSHKISYDYVLKIEAYTEGYVTRHELAPQQKEVNKILDQLIEAAFSQGENLNNRTTQRR